MQEKNRINADMLSHLPIPSRTENQLATSSIRCKLTCHLLRSTIRDATQKDKVLELVLEYYQSGQSA